MTGRLSWGVIGTGIIAGRFAGAVAESKTGSVTAVASRTAEAAESFAARYAIPRSYPSYQALIDDAEVEAVYISTPHPMHAEWAIRAAQAGKHVLCEKPLAMNHAEALEVIDVARRSDVFLMEAFMYRLHPQTAKIISLIREGAIGDVRLIQSSFSFHAPYEPEKRILNRELGGGGILDVGCYCVSFSRLVAGVAVGRDFAEPLEVKALGHIGATGVDEYAAAVLRFPNDIIAQVSTGVQLAQENSAHIYGTLGSIHIPSPWLPGSKSEIVLTRGGRRETIKIKCPKDIYTIEADLVAASIAARQAPPPAPTWEDTLGNMLTLDRWREEIGLRYPQDGK